jgi:ribose transport system substrate-binding protein
MYRIEALIHTLPALMLCLASICQARDCIGVVPAGGGYAFWDAVQAGAHKAGRELGVDIYFRGPTDEADTESQRLILNKVVELHCKALVLAPNSPDRASDVATLQAEGIPTVYIDRDAAHSNAAAVIATDNYRAGQRAGQEMAKALKGHGRVVVLRMNENVISTSDRERGFIEAARKAGLTVVDAGYIGTTIGKERDRVEHLLGPLRGRFDGIFTPNESTTVSTLLTLRRIQMAGHVVHIGFDAGKLPVEALRAGTLYGLIVQQPFEMGYQGVRAAYRKMHGETISPTHIDLNVVFVTRANMREPRVAALLLGN